MLSVARDLGQLTKTGNLLFFNKYVHEGYLLKNYVKKLKEVSVKLVVTESFVHDGVMGVNVPFV